MPDLGKNNLSLWKSRRVNEVTIKERLKRFFDGRPTVGQTMVTLRIGKAPKVNQRSRIVRVTVKIERVTLWKVRKSNPFGLPSGQVITNQEG